MIRYVVEIAPGPDECPANFRCPETMDCRALFFPPKNFRRLIINNNYLAETAESMAQFSFVQIMHNRFSMISKQLLSV